MWYSDETIRAKLSEKTMWSVRSISPAIPVIEVQNFRGLGANHQTSISTSNARPREDHQHTRVLCAHLKFYMQSDALTSEVCMSFLVLKSCDCATTHTRKTRNRFADYTRIK
jgi:hypothetical protein